MSRSPRDNSVSDARRRMRYTARRATTLVLAAAAHLLAAAIAAAGTPSPDDVYLVSTRPLGTRCVAEEMSAGLYCQRLVDDGDQRHWSKTSWPEVAAAFAEPLPTIVYVHGNRVSPGEDKQQGLAFYHSLANCRPPGRLRFVIWAWPADQIRGRVRDYAVKAARTTQVGWQLAWAVNQLPQQSPVTLVGYSYGARVVTGALHLLGGGSMGDLKLYEPENPLRPPLRAALVAAAVDAAWLRPGGYHGEAVGEVESLVLINNQLDPAMRFFHLPAENRHARALGYTGLRASGAWGDMADRIHSFDATGAVGRHHAIAEYLSAFGAMRHAWEKMLPATPIDGAPAPRVMVDQGDVTPGDAG
jgi:hypothetical protein